MAARYAPDALGLLQTDVTYGTMGDHGGHTRLTEKIPMIFSWPGLRSEATPGKEIGVVDVVPTVLKTMGIYYNARELDGAPVKLPRR